MDEQSQTAQHVSQKRRLFEYFINPKVCVKLISSVVVKENGCDDGGAGNRTAKNSHPIKFTTEFFFKIIIQWGLS